MKNNELILKRKEFLNNISGKWKSDEFTDNERNKIRIILFIGNNFSLTDQSFVVKVNKKYSATDLREYPISFHWIGSDLRTGNSDLKQGMLVKKEKKNEIGFYYDNSELIDEKLILRFKKI